jgi:hypothetical protein
LSFPREVATRLLLVPVETVVASLPCVSYEFVVVAENVPFEQGVLGPLDVTVPD